MWFSFFISLGLLFLGLFGCDRFWYVSVSGGVIRFVSRLSYVVLGYFLFFCVVCSVGWVSFGFFRYSCVFGCVGVWFHLFLLRSVVGFWLWGGV